MHKSSAVNRWRAQVTRHRVAFALLAGFLATHIATITGYWYPVWNWPKMDYGVLNGMILVPKEDPTTQFIIGMIAHYGTGMCFALIYAFLIHPLLPGPNSVPANVLKALAFGMLLATFACLMWIPGNFPQLHAGFFMHNLGWQTIAATYLWHVFYAVHLGALYSPLPEEAEPEPAPSLVGAGALAAADSHGRASARRLADAVS
jgi:hypothetical protein